MYHDRKIIFLQYIKKKKKNQKLIAVIQKLRHILPRHPFIIICKSFVRPHFAYCDIIYDQPNIERFCNKIEKVQYNAALSITIVIRETSQTKLYSEFGLESLKFRRWMRKLSVFYKVKSLKIPEYLFYLILNYCRSDNT